jgi:hypothetical protein
MQKEELKALVQKYFNLVDAKEGTKQTFVEAELIDDTKITNAVDADFEVGQKLYVITEENEQVAAPSGEHQTKSGILLTVDGEGTITGVKHPDQEGEGSLEAEEEMSAEEVIKTSNQEMAEQGDEQVMEEYDIKEAVIEAIAEVVAPELESMKQKMAEMEEKMKDYMSKSPSAVPTAEAKFAKIQEVKNKEAKGLSFDAKAAQKEMVLKAWKNKNK